MSDKHHTVIVGDLSGIGKSVADALIDKGVSVIGRTPDGDYYFHNDPNTSINIDLYVDNVDTILDCGSIDTQCWAKDDPNGDVFMKVMENANRKIFQLYHEFINALRKNKGIWITVASVSAKADMTCSSAYCGTKAATVQTIRVLAREEDRIVGDGENHASIFTVSPILVPETPLVQNLIGEYMISRNVSDRKKAEKDFCTRLYNKHPLHLEDVTKFFIHLLYDNRELSRSMSGSNMSLGDQM